MVGWECLSSWLDLRKLNVSHCGMKTEDKKTNLALGNYFLFPFPPCASSQPSKDESSRLTGDCASVSHLLQVHPFLVTFVEVPGCRDLGKACLRRISVFKEAILWRWGVLLTVGDAGDRLQPAATLWRFVSAQLGQRVWPAVCLCASALCISCKPCGVPGVLGDLVNKFCCFCCCDCRQQLSVPGLADLAKNCLNGRLW